MGESESLLRAITDAIPDPRSLEGRDGAVLGESSASQAVEAAGQVLADGLRDLLDLAVGEAVMATDQVMNGRSASWRSGSRRPNRIVSPRRPTAT